MKKNYALIVVVLCLFSLKSSAQESIIGDINYGLLEKYIQAAREYYPRRKVLVAQEEVARVGIGAAKVSYLDLLNVSYIYRPEHKAAADPTGLSNYNVNGFQFGASLNIGAFLQKPYLVKRAKAEYKVAQLQTEDYDVVLVSEVKKRYYLYVQMLAELKIRTQKTLDSKSVSDNARRKFEKGELSMDIYNSSRVLVADSNSEKLQTEVNYLNAKDALEEIIGKKLSEIN